MKIGQVFALSIDFLGAEKCRKLAGLYSRQNKLHPEAFEALIAQNGGDEFLSKFAEFDRSPFAVASVGQVHRARLRNGSDVAVKMVKGDLRPSFERDIARVVGLDKIYRELPHHTIVFADDYRSSIQSIFDSKELTDDISFYIRNSSVTDPYVAPKGRSGLYVLVPAPNQNSGIDREKQKFEFRDRVIRKIVERTPLKDLESHIIAEQMMTPLDWEKKSNVYLGATFNLAHTLTQMLYFRPHNRFEEIDNMYLVGGGTHPGSGLPTIYESARISSNIISEKYGVPYRKPSDLSEKSGVRNRQVHHRAPEETIELEPAGK